MSGRREKLSRQIAREMGMIMQQVGKNQFPGSLITVTDASVTPDLGLAKIYLSVMGAKSSEAVIEELNLYMKEIRHLLAKELKDHVRRIPELRFYPDHTLDQALKMDALIENLLKPKDE